MKCYERFLNYVSYETTSDPQSNSVPSTPKQLVLAKALVEEMIALGIQNVVMTDKGYVYGEIPSNTDKKIDTIGFIAHMDTSPDISAANIKPRIIENYNGKDVVLNQEAGIIMKIKDFPFLSKKKGESLIVTDGTTLLGADDKAGISEIITMAEQLINSDIPHGTIKIGFTPDEEIGRGADHFDINYFGADYAFTVDGGDVEDVEFENFNAASAVVTLKGVNIHPGSAKNKMINSINFGFEFDSMLPKDARPQFTEGYEGFNHLNDIKGTVEETKLYYIIRNHDRQQFEKQKEDFYKIAETMNKKYGDFVSVEINDSYYNMVECLKDKMEIVEIAKRAIAKTGLKPSSSPIRGGTDGARLTFEGLPCPNLGTGGYNFHGRYECITIEDMDRIVNILLEIVKDVANK